MTMETNAKRDEWVESEFKKWQENFIISFDEEFEVKAILDLQWQYKTVEDSHVKTKSDILSIVSRAKRDLMLKPKDREKIFLVEANNYSSGTDWSMRIGRYIPTNIEYISTFIHDKSLELCVEKLIEIVKIEKPSKILFNINEKGYSAYDNFIINVKKKNIHIESNGAVFYGV